jgi:hypothetical protein
MGYGRKWKPSKTAIKNFVKQMDAVETFCAENGISSSRTNDSYYFTLNGKKYRVSNHTVDRSNRKAYDFFGNQVREKYHGEDDDLICITAGKTRIVEIYTLLKSGAKLDKRGYPVKEE